MIEGGCFCGAVRYRIDAGSYLTANCHCSMCRRTSAAPFVTWIVVPTKAFNYTQGTPRQLNSSEKAERYFCGDCGTHLTCTLHDKPDDVDVTVGSLDAPEMYTPTVAVFEDTKLPWLGETERPSAAHGQSADR